jgi:flagellar M-ring protein FliF
VNYAALLERWNAFTWQVRAAIVGGASLVFIVLLAVAIGIYQTKVSQVPLFAKALTSDQISEVDSQLSGWQIPFTTTADNVIVDKAQRSDILLKLSMVGIPHPTLGDSTDDLSKVGPMTPQSVLDIQTRNALGSDLALALRGIDGIADARVIIAPGKEAFFADEDSSQASAAVRINMMPGHTLKHDAIDGIRHFIANGVSGLSADHVTVMDDSGSALGDENSVDANANNTIQTQVQSALDRALGPGMSIVTVHSEINKTARHEYVYKNLPVAGAAIQKTVTDERLAGKDRAYSKVHENDTNGNQGVATRSEVLPGGIARLSVSVMIDQSLIDEESEIRATVSAAAGVDASRGDVLTVAPVMFHHALAPMVSNGQPMIVAQHALPGLTIGIFVLGALFLAMQPLLAVLRRNANREILSHTKALEPGVDIAAIWRTIHGEPAHVAAAVISQLPTSIAVAVLDMYPEQERREITERLARPIAPVLVDIVKVPTHA